METPTNLFRVDGMVAVVTGGGTGIGLVMSRALAAAGASHVFILGRRLAVLEEAISASSPSYRHVLYPVQCDVTSKSSLQAAVDLVALKAAGLVNLVIANSGIMGPIKPDGLGPDLTVSQLRKSVFEDNDLEAFTDTFRVNVSGAYFTMMAFLGLLDEGNRRAAAAIPASSKPPAVQSQVIVTSSIGGFVKNAGSMTAYAASKAATTHLVKVTSSDLARYGIRVNAFAPGLFPSEIAITLMGSRDPSQETPQDPNFIPARRFGDDKEITGAVLYLASRAGSYCNGSILVFDGGRLSVMPSTY